MFKVTEYAALTGSKDTVPWKSDVSFLIEYATRRLKYVLTKQGILFLHARIQRGDRRSGPPSPWPLKNHKN